MLLQINNFPNNTISKSRNNLTPANSHFVIFRRKFSTCQKPFRCVSQLTCPSVSISDVTDVFHNKVIVSAAVSAAIGQLAKPFTSKILYGKKFDLRATIQAGGFPSTHSSAVVATATSLVLERGFSDSIFGLAAVYASLVMYDAQGVRREVGIHAKEINKFLLRTTPLSTSSRNDPVDIINSFSRESSANVNSEEKNLLPQKKERSSSVLLNSNENIQRSFSAAVSDVNERSENIAFVRSQLKETVGHTEIEVAAGALLGFLVSLAVCCYV